MNLKVLFFIVCLCGFFVGGMSEVNAQDKCIDDNIVARGLLPVYKFEDKVYVLIAEELLNREFMITAQIDKGRGKYGELLESKGVFVLKPGKDNELNVYGVGAIEQQTDNQLQNCCSLELGGLKNSREVWKAERSAEGGYLVEITEWLQESGEWYSFDNSLRISDFATPDILGVVAYENGVCFRVRHCVTVSPKQGVVVMAAENGKAYIDVSVALKLLPKDKGETVIMFPDSPFRTQQAMDYGIAPWGCAKCDRGVHWSISKEAPLKISVGTDMPEIYQNTLQTVITKVSKKIGIVDGIVLERKNQPLDAMDQCGVVFAGDSEVSVRCMEHPATGHLLFGRMSVGERNMDARILRWQLKNWVVDNEKWSVYPREYVYEKCLEEEMENGLLMLLGVDETCLEDDSDISYIWNSVRYVYAGDYVWLKKERERPVADDLWGHFIESRNGRKKLLEQLELELVVDYYTQCLVLGEEDYASVFKRGDWKAGDVSRLLELMNEDASGFYTTDYIRKNMLGRNANEINEGLIRVWCEFFNLDRWLEWARRGGSSDVFGILERELGNWLYEGNRRKFLSPAAMMVWCAFSDALGKQLESCRESINYGSGVAENMVLSCWESLYEQCVGN